MSWLELLLLLPGIRVLMFRINLKQFGGEQNAGIEVACIKNESGSFPHLHFETILIVLGSVGSISETRAKGEIDTLLSYSRSLP